MKKYNCTIMHYYLNRIKQFSTNLISLQKKGKNKMS